MVYRLEIGGYYKGDFSSLKTAKEYAEFYTK